MNPNPQNQTGNNQDWDACPTGELTRLGDGLRMKAAKHQRAQSIRLGGLVTALLLVAFVGYQVTTGALAPGEQISCQACANMFDEYHAHLTTAESMGATELEQMEGHLAYCKKCRDAFETTYPGIMPEALQVAGFGLFGLYVLATSGVLRRK